MALGGFRDVLQIIGVLPLGAGLPPPPQIDAIYVTALFYTHVSTGRDSVVDVPLVPYANSPQYQTDAGNKLFGSP